jgi:hypothetical protein
MISLHIAAISAGSADSNFDAIIACEYPIHCPSRGYSTVMHNTVDYRTTLLFNFKTQKRRKRSAEANPDGGRQGFGDHDPPERRFINRKVNM